MMTGGTPISGNHVTVEMSPSDPDPAPQYRPCSAGYLWSFCIHCLWDTSSFMPVLVAQKPILLMFCSLIFAGWNHQFCWWKSPMLIPFAGENILSFLMKRSNDLLLETWNQTVFLQVPSLLRVTLIVCPTPGKNPLQIHCLVTKN